MIPPSAPPLNILYVDDDPDIRHIVRLSLALDPAITLRLAASAPDALALLDEGHPPDIAVLDMMMPGMDGLALLARLRLRPDTATLPVIFMTARGRPADSALYRDRGAIGMILKPFDPLTLAGEIREMVRGSGVDDG